MTKLLLEIAVYMSHGLYIGLSGLMRGLGSAFPRMDMDIMEGALSTTLVFVRYVFRISALGYGFASHIGSDTGVFMAIARTWLVDNFAVKQLIIWNILQA